MKNKLLIALCILSVSITSCLNNDDDITLPAPVILNQMVYGTGATDFIELAAAYNSPVTPIGTGGFTTLVQLVDENFNEDMGALDGIGEIVFLQFTGNQNVAIQQGIYNIGDDPTDVGNVTVSYSLDYDTANPINATNLITSGAVRVTAYRSGFIIEIVGKDANDVEFHGNFVGNLIPLE